MVQNLDKAHVMELQLCRCPLHKTRKENNGNTCIKMCTLESLHTIASPCWCVIRKFWAKEPRSIWRRESNNRAKWRAHAEAFALQWADSG